MRYLLFVSDTFVLAHAVGRSGFSNGVVFKKNQRGLEQFSQYLDERASAVFCGVVDSTEEELYQEQLPRLSARDTKRAVKSIVEARCERAVLWRHCTQLVGTDPGDELQLTITTVPYESGCADWLSILKDKNILLSELCLLSDLCVEIQPSGVAVASILVLKISHCNYRIIGFRNGLPVITRRLEESRVSGQVLLTEINKTVKFLNGADEKSDHQVPVRYLGDTTAEQRDELQKGGVIVKAMHEIAAKNFLGNTSRHSGVNLLLQLMLSKRIRRERRLAGCYRSAYDFRRLNHGFCAGICCCVAVATASGIAGARMIDSLGELSGEIKVRSAELDERIASFQSASYSAVEVDAMRRTVEIGYRINRLKDHTPMRLLVPLATELSKFSEVHITSVDWQMKNPMMELNVIEEAEYEALVSGYIDRSISEMGEVARSFNGFVSGLERSDQIDFVDIRSSPLGSDRTGAMILSDNSTTPWKFTINLSVRESLQ